MASPLRLSSRLIKNVHRCWETIGAADVSQPQAALVTALGALSELVDAQNAYWLGAVRLSTPAGDPMAGWRPRAVVHWKPSDADRTFVKKTTHQHQAGQVDESSLAQTQEAGVFRARLLRELVSPQWFESGYYQMAYRDRDICDVVTVVSPINKDAESYLAFQRKGRRAAFTAADRDLLAHAIRPLQMFQRQLMLGYGLSVACSALTPAERGVLSALLTAKSEKQIAASLSLTVRTTHSYVTGVFRKFGVTSRAGLMALWIGHPG